MLRIAMALRVTSWILVLLLICRMLLHVVVAGRICLVRLLHIRLVALRRAILVLLGNAVIDGGPYRLRLYLREHALVTNELQIGRAHV